MEYYAERERTLYQPWKTLTSNFTKQKETVINPLLLFYLQMWFVVKKNTALLKVLKTKISTALYTMQWTQEEK